MGPDAPSAPSYSIAFPPPEHAHFEAGGITVPDSLGPVPFLSGTVWGRSRFCPGQIGAGPVFVRDRLGPVPEVSGRKGKGARAHSLSIHLRCTAGTPEHNWGRFRTGLKLSHSNQPDQSQSALLFVNFSIDIHVGFDHVHVNVAIFGGVAFHFKAHQHVIRL